MESELDGAAVVLKRVLATVLQTSFVLKKPPFLPVSAPQRAT